ncbi:protein phosphatase [Leishmania donovani]|uniref:protein-tyrosine-phosphatase n=1 Tax=Leishmania donovani TaxID=5661 RepID=A0A504XGA3_LEIDO|nr:Dual specificity phosphatase, catalytic domain family protein [Leishmania donovani]CAJ1993283.1 protein phosphatase [Leishmania donovani]VDZ49110.1 protein_phosphatase_putative/GeneDB:LmjF.35.4650 [Leishmania donovani]
MDTRCCTPPSIGGGDDLFLASCRHQLFVNEEDDHEAENTALEASVTLRPSDSFPRLSQSHASEETRPSDPLDTNVELPSPIRLPRSPRRAFQPIPINLPGDNCFGRTAFQGWPVEATASDGITSTPWRPPTTSGQPSAAPAAAPAAHASMAHLQTPEVQRTNYAVATPNMMGHLLYTPQISPVCQAWRTSLDTELDSVNTRWAADQLPSLTTLIDNALYVGGFPDSQTVPQLYALGIRHIVNCCAQDIRTAPEVAESFHLHYFESYDSEEYLILHRDYDAFAGLMSTILENGEKAFVHCIAGVNRSVVLCAAYLMDRLSLNPVEAVRVFRANGRMRILDNKGFRHQLIDHYLQSIEPQNARVGLL